MPDHRQTVRVEDGFVLFLIGFRINRLWKVHRWLPVLFAMPPMLRELSRNRELGMLHSRMQIGLRAITLVQYWQSVEQLQAYAHARERNHLPKWRDFNRRIGDSGDVGIWHETYVIEPGAYECVHVNMPPYGLTRAFDSLPARGAMATAKSRLGR